MAYHISSMETRVHPLFTKPLYVHELTRWPTRGEWTYVREEPVVGCRWTGWVRLKMPDWSSRLQFTEHFKGIYRIYLKWIKQNRRVWTCSRLGLELLWSWPTMPKNFPSTSGAREAPKHMRHLTTLQVLCQVKRRFHSRESNHQPLPWDLDISSAV